MVVPPFSLGSGHDKTITSAKIDLGSGTKLIKKRVPISSSLARKIVFSA